MVQVDVKVNGKWKWVDYVGMLEGKDLGQSELWNGRREVRMESLK